MKRHHIIRYFHLNYRLKEKLGTVSALIFLLQSVGFTQVTQATYTLQSDNGVPLLSSEGVQGAWSPDRVSLFGRVYRPAPGSLWREVLSGPDDNFILIEEQETTRPEQDRIIVYLKVEEDSEIPDTLSRLSIPFDGVLPRVSLTAGGELVMLHVVEGWISRGSQRFHFANSHNYERQAWIVNGGQAFTLLWGPRDGYYVMQEMSLSGSGGISPIYETLEMNHIVAISQSEGGRVAIAGYRRVNGVVQHRLTIYGRGFQLVEEIPIQARHVAWSDEEVAYTTRTEAYRHTPSGSQRLVSWTRALKPVAFYSVEGGLLLVLSGEAHPTPDGWIHQDVVIYTGPGLSRRQGIPEPVLIKTTSQFLQVGSNLYPIRRQP
ncbi:hypothetical protein ACFL45_11015 [Candidatus Neomarinimicrobiota bacterium]